ncbi:phosphoribosylglycinamide formyltransferase [Serratia fonticola]|jgi:phosphoribosylglycinamide formyltransferase-1|uniref:phosphoribosylglycinamide formyltransferase n=1 Tax=Serratia fonticola TaxID=47917 RepID=UPI00217726AA|nr:phosphoribosylglycinamide formyltransferase [Serratia fonticola]CAI0827223.1 Phosphoribosylglycinamide formyltransferase [Serratia fonticola]CAI1771804.1 Phosphoribosylglycinamide formyltransferase [Serratia fonticola]
MKKIVVLVSGQGSNLQALIDACQQGRIAATIVAVFSNNVQAYGLQRAEEAGIAAQALDAKAFADREAFDAGLAQAIDQYQPDLVVLAGYMRILSNAFVQHYAGRMLNIHPSLLPKYPGLHTHRQAIDNGDAEHGTSVHFVTEQLDGGPVILQAKVPIFPGDEEDEVIERVQTQEHTLYPLVVSWFIEGRLAMRDNAAWLDGERLSAQGYAAD